MNKHECSHLVVVDGNIGSGKTTLLQHIDTTLDTVVTSDEPVDKWCNFHGHNVLGNMYKSAAEWVCRFQILVVTSLFGQTENVVLNRFAAKRQVLVTAGSMETAVFVYSKNGMKSGFLSRFDYKLIKYTYERLNRFAPTPTKYGRLLLHMNAHTSVDFNFPPSLQFTSRRTRNCWWHASRSATVPRSRAFRSSISSRCL